MKANDFKPRGPIGGVEGYGVVLKEAVATQDGGHGQVARETARYRDHATGND